MSYPSNKFGHSGFVNSKVAGDFSEIPAHWGVQTKVVQDGTGILGSDNSRIGSAATSHISSIQDYITRIRMSHTWGIVAVMKYIYPIWNRAVNKLISLTMSEHRSTAGSTDAKYPIPIVIDLAGPDPTCSKFGVEYRPILVNLGPETGFYIGLKGRHEISLSGWQHHVQHKRLHSSHAPYLNG